MSDLNCKRDCFKEAVCIEAERIFDSCSDKDCLVDLPVSLNCPLSENVTVVKSKNVEVCDVCISVEPVPFNKGFFSVDITYTFCVTLDAFEAACGTPKTVKGTAVFSKRVILFGSEGNSKTFCSNGFKGDTTNICNVNVNLPQACVQVVDPIVLDAKLVCKFNGDCGCCDCDNCHKDGCKDDCHCTKSRKHCVLITLGVFSIVQLSRTVSVLVPIYDYCVPHKECTSASSPESPCEMFDKIKFPTEEFFPTPLPDNGSDCGCKS